MDPIARYIIAVDHAAELRRAAERDRLACLARDSSESPSRRARVFRVPGRVGPKHTRGTAARRAERTGTPAIEAANYRP